MFHRILPDPDPLFPRGIDADTFQNICMWLKDWFNVLPLAEAVARMTRASLPARAACLSFDDGYADNYTHALPILKRHGLNATFFISTGFLDGGRMWHDTIIETIRSVQSDTIDLRALHLGVIPTRSLNEKRAAIATLLPALKQLDSKKRSRVVSHIATHSLDTLPDNLMLTTDQLSELHKAGMEIGAHTVTHPILTQCEDETARVEISESRAHLEALTGESVTLFAYPSGRFSSDYTLNHAQMVRELGFAAAVSTNRGTSRHGDDVFHLRRFTPWRQDRWRFGLTLFQNLIHRGSFA